MVIFILSLGCLAKFYQKRCENCPLCVHASFVRICFLWELYNFINIFSLWVKKFRTLKVAHFQKDWFQIDFKSFFEQKIFGTFAKKIRLGSQNFLVVSSSIIAYSFWIFKVPAQKFLSNKSPLRLLINHFSKHLAKPNYACHPIFDEAQCYGIEFIEWGEGETTSKATSGITPKAIRCSLARCYRFLLEECLNFS